MQKGRVARLRAPALPGAAGGLLLEQRVEGLDHHVDLGLDVLAKSRLTLVTDNDVEEVIDTVLELSA